MTDEFPLAAAGKPLWLVTLADLALLLVGFLVLIQATRHDTREALTAGFRERFGGAVAGNQPPPAPMPVAAAGMMDFAPGSAALPGSTDTLVAWARDATRDPRVTLTVTGQVDGTPADRDAQSGSATLLATDRARAVAAALAGVVPADRLVVTTTNRHGRRVVVVTLAFAGETQ